MDLVVYLQLVFLCVVNIIFTFSGIILNTLVIVSIWESSQLRKKLCHFMIMVLSCFDFVSVVTNYPGILVFLISWLRKDYDLLHKMGMYLDFVSIFIPFSFYVLFVMIVEQYLGAYHVIFHRTSVTRRRLLTVLTILLILHTILHVISTNDMIICRTLVAIFFITVVFPPLVYLNFKLSKISRDMRRRNATPSKKGWR